MIKHQLDFQDIKLMTMFNDLEKQAQDYTEKAILRLRETLIATEYSLFSAIAEAYKQGYRDALTIKKIKMISKFKVGDKVRIIGSTTEAGKAKIGQVGEILDIDRAFGKCFVLYPKGQDWVREKDLKLVTSAPTDPKREFLERLQSLMREFDAKIHVYAGEDGDRGIGFYFGEPEENHIWYTNEWCGNKFEFPITADNIMDFDKD